MIMLHHLSSDEIRLILSTLYHRIDSLRGYRMEPNLKDYGREEEVAILALVAKIYDIDDN